jgi:hypothetical protein
MSLFRGVGSVLRNAKAHEEKYAAAHAATEQLPLAA